MGSAFRRAVPLAWIAAIVGIHQASAQEPVDIELVLAVDLSISVDGAEFDLQRQGLVAAFRDPTVIEAIRANAQGIAIAVVLWAGAEQQRIAVDWQHLTDSPSSLAFAATIDRALRIDPEFFGKTAIGSAMYFALQALDGNDFSGIRRKIDVSGDGRANEGFKPERVRDFAARSGVTVNGLAIINDEPYLEQYYRTHVIGGPAAFVLVADDYEDFIQAIRLKLLRELAPGETVYSGGYAVAVR